MNRIINTLALATAGLVLLCGCSADPATDEAAPGGNDGKTVPVSFAAELPATRATIEIGDDRFNGAWEVDIDKLGIHATLNGVAQINKPFVFSSEGIFKGELTPGTGAWTYLAYYPHGEQSLNGTSATIPFGNTRIQKGGTYNSLFDILIAPAQTTANSAEGVDDSGERIRFNMQRLTSILDFDLTNSTSDPIRCVLLTAESDDFLSAKSLNFDLAQGEAAAPALDTEERSKSILINFDGGSASAAAQLDAFFNVLPGNYNLNLDIITATKQMASVKIDRTDKPFEAGVLYKKEVGTLTPSAIPAPSLDWPDQDIDATHEITVGPDQSLTYPAAIDITVPGGIAELKVEIVSDALNSLGIQNLDLVHETSIAGSIQIQRLGSEMQHGDPIYEIDRIRHHQARPDDCDAPRCNRQPRIQGVRYRPGRPDDRTGPDLPLRPGNARNRRPVAKYRNAENRPLRNGRERDARIQAQHRRRLAAGDRFRQRQRHFHGRDRADLEFIDQRNG